jgi:hypothetical protein
MSEEYRDIPNIPGLRVSRCGHIQQLDRWSQQWVPKTLYANTTTGYIQVMRDYGSGGHKQITVHRAVALAWIENTYGYIEVNHKDGNRHNNHADNLEWCNRQQNAQHAFRNRRGERMWSSKTNEETVKKILHDFLVLGKTQDELKATYGISTQGICQRTIWHHVPLPPKPWAKNRQNVIAARLG